MSEGPIQSKRGQILSFYSYKGGTGRSMAVANIAWILASRGKRVLVVDWDLEAPGLHRYFHPFLDDPELRTSFGIIDYFHDVMSAAAGAIATTPSDGTTPWWHRWTSLLRYTCVLDTTLLGKDFAGSIDFIPAGRQGPDYGQRVGLFDWQQFYQIGGGVLLEAVKQRLRERYDYVLIDSRTGLSDTSGICTVQMPDDLVVCFTLNRQSVLGAAAVARSVRSQRTKPDGLPGIRIWPLPTRVELAERDRLEAARDKVRGAFLEFLGPLLRTREERNVYWGRAEVLYQPYFAYDEVLAVFAERRNQTSSMLASFEYLTQCLTDGVVTSLVEWKEASRRAVLSRFEVRTSSKQVYLSYQKGLEGTVARVARALSAAGIPYWYYEERVRPGDDFVDAMERGLRESSLMIHLIGPERGDGQWRTKELNWALEQQLRVIPVLAAGAGYDRLPRELARVQALMFAEDGPDVRDLDSLTSLVEDLVRRDDTAVTPEDPEDPQKGRWGGSPTADGWALQATVSLVPGSNKWFNVTLVAKAPDAAGDGKVVRFHLHPTFDEREMEVVVVSRKATLELRAWGAFTAGAEVVGTGTRLEMDLSQNVEFPKLFRSR